MDVYELQAKIALDTSEYTKGLDEASNKSSTFKDVLKANFVFDFIKTGLSTAANAVKKFVTDSIEVGMSFDKSMSQVAATMGLSTSEMEKQVGSVDTAYGKFSGNLREYAEFMGSKTAFSASQAAEALNYMALAGYDANTSMSMLPNVLNLAAAGGMELAQASDMVTDAQSALGLNIDETTALVDKMAKASSKSNTSVSQLGEAMLTIGGTAKNLSGGTTELAQALGLLADNGIKGAEGGTALRNILLNLSPKSKEAAEAMKAIGLNAYDANGKMRPLKDVFQDLNKGLEGMTDQQKTNVLSSIFNKVDLKSVNALLATNVERWDELSTAIDNSQGSAQAMADTQLDNLAGDVTLFQSALEGAQIAVSEGLAPTLRSFVSGGTESLTQLTDAFRSDGLSGAISSLGSIAKKTASGLITAFSDAAPKAMTKAGEIMESLGNGLKTGIPKILPVALNAIMEFSGNLRENASKLVDSGLDLIVNLADGLIAALPSLIETVPTIVSNIVGIINDNAPKLLVTGIELLGHLALGIIEAIPTLIAEFPKIMQMIIDVISAINWMNTGASIIKGLSGGIKKLATNIPNALKEICKNTVNAVKKIAWLDLGKHLIESILKGIKALVTTIPNMLKTIGKNAFDAFKNIDWKSLGSNIISGIVNGLKNGASAVVNAAKGVAQSAFDAAKNALGIHSPSRKFMWIGQMVDEGYAEGIDKNSGKVEKAMESLTDINIDTDSIDFPKPKPRGDGPSEGAGGNNITINVYGAEGQDERELADTVAERINHAASQEILVWS